MRSNLSTSDRWVRTVAGAIGVFLGILASPIAAWATIAWFLGGALLITGVAGYCPVYDLLGFSSLEAEGAGDDYWGDRGGNP